ncbi:hypothetical protein MWH06_02255 [Wolbachia pipientis]|nr:hypothetical protein MWH06_02255 [Wolbachia pipientis]
MPNQKKFASYAAVTIGSLGLIASTIALTMCSSSLSPLIVGGMIGSIIPLVGCTLVGILLLINTKKVYGGIYDQKRINEKAKLFDSLSKYVVPLIASAVVCFGIGAGLVALGFTSPVAIIALTLIANAIVIQLFSKITERFSSPPPPSGSVDSDVKVDGVADKTLFHPYCC